MSIDREIRTCPRLVSIGFHSNLSAATAIAREEQHLAADHRVVTYDLATDIDELRAVVAAANGSAIARVDGEPRSLTFGPRKR